MNNLWLSTECIDIIHDIINGLLNIHIIANSFAAGIAATPIQQMNGWIIG